VVKDVAGRRRLGGLHDDETSLLHDGKSLAHDETSPAGRDNIISR
jgi:hypothetical protein